jgi:hypothetical protein
MGNGAAMVESRKKGTFYKYATEQTAVYGKTWAISILGKYFVHTSNSETIRDLLTMVRPRMTACILYPSNLVRIRNLRMLDQVKPSTMRLVFSHMA